MISTQQLLLNGQRPAKKGFGLIIPLLIHQDRGKVVQALGCNRVFRADILDDHQKSFKEKRFCYRGEATCPVLGGKVSEGDGNREMIITKMVFADGKSALYEWQYFLKPFLPEIERCEIVETCRNVWMLRAIGSFCQLKCLLDGLFRLFKITMLIECS